MPQRLLSSSAPGLVLHRRTARLHRPVARRTMAQQLDKSTSDEVWRARLTPEEYHVIRQKGTERPGSGEYNNFLPTAGHFACRACLQPLYKAESAFSSGCGWPAFYDFIPGSVEKHEDTSLGMRRVEITCSKCGGHLGHVFDGEGFPTPTDSRHCVNSLSIKFVAADK